MATVLRAADLTPETLAGQLAGLRPPEGEPVRVWLEAADGWALAWWPPELSRTVPWCGSGREPEERPLTELLPGCESGRVFAPSGELRWRRLRLSDQVRCRTVFLGEEGWAPAGLALHCALEGLGPQPRTALLWGLLTSATRRTDGQTGDWIELRIPHRFQYPLRDLPEPGKSGLRVGVELEAWCDAAGETHFLRLCDLVSCSEK
jgi:hypothetical protein